MSGEVFLDNTGGTTITNHGTLTIDDGATLDFFRSGSTFPRGHRWDALARSASPEPLSSG